MNKQEYLVALRTRLEEVHSGNVDSLVEFYEEMINDRIEDGMNEEDAVADMEPVDEIVNQVLAEMPMPQVMKEKVKRSKEKAEKSGKNGLWIALTIIGFPLWFPLTIAFFAIILSIYIVFWSLIISLFAVEFSFAVGAVGCLAGMVMACTPALPFITFFPALGIMLLLGGLSVVLWAPALFLTKKLILLPKNMVTAIKKWII